MMTANHTSNAWRRLLLEALLSLVGDKAEESSYLYLYIFPPQERTQEQSWKEIIRLLTNINRALSGGSNPFPFTSSDEQRTTSVASAQGRRDFEERRGGTPLRQEEITGAAVAPARDCTQPHYEGGAQADQASDFFACEDSVGRNYRHGRLFFENFTQYSQHTSEVLRKLQERRRRENVEHSEYIAHPNATAAFVASLDQQHNSGGSSDAATLPPQEDFDDLFDKKCQKIAENTINEDEDALLKVWPENDNPTVFGPSLTPGFCNNKDNLLSWDKNPKSAPVINKNGQETLHHQTSEANRCGLKDPPPATNKTFASSAYTGNSRQQFTPPSNTHARLGDAGIDSVVDLSTRGMDLRDRKEEHVRNASKKRLTVENERTTPFTKREQSHCSTRQHNKKMRCGSFKKDPPETHSNTFPCFQTVQEDKSMLAPDSGLSYLNMTNQVEQVETFLSKKFYTTVGVDNGDFVAHQEAHNFQHDQRSWQEQELHDGTYASFQSPLLLHEQHDLLQFSNVTSPQPAPAAHQRLSTSTRNEMLSDANRFRSIDDDVSDDLSSFGMSQSEYSGTPELEESLHYNRWNAGESGDASEEMTRAPEMKPAVEQARPLEVFEADVVGGQGSGPSNHPGNREYLSRVEIWKPAYQELADRDLRGKHRIALLVYDFVIDRGGRFIHKNGDRLLSRADALKKIKRALRETRR